MRQIEFGCNEVLIEGNHGIPNLKTFYIGFDLGKYRLDSFSEIVMDALVDFAFGYHTGILKQYTRRKLIEAAKSLYSIKEINDYKTNYIDQNAVLEDSDPSISNKYQKRGEFGELILHILLRDYFQTTPLLSKIYFKDSDGITIHGFDSVHIGPDLTNENDISLYLGESKLYYRKDGDAGKYGIKDLVQDIESHFDVDFLKRECILIAKKRDSYSSIERYFDKNSVEAFKTYLDKKNEYMDLLQAVGLGKLKIQEFVNSITVPLICTYESKLFSSFKHDQINGFKEEYHKEMDTLHSLLKKELNKLPTNNGQIDKSNLNIVLILFPIPSKLELLRTLHNKLWNQQNA
ncbi:HamA C-terminal domain-containing protein [Gilliamella apicola]|uniref:HamA C-terminal domain-containing protein n=1 Tax=Gilliamella apicola TaxID=1196095 RepID=UPI002FEE28ED